MRRKTSIYELPDGSWDIEREEADYQQAQFEVEERARSQQIKRAHRAYLSGDKAKAAKLCPHGAGYIIPMDTTRKTNGEVCYCTPSPGTKTRLGHVHAAKLTFEEWARGILVMEALAGNSMVPWLTNLPRAAKQARTILKRTTRGGDVHHV